MSVLQDLIVEAISSHKRQINMGHILNGYWDVDIWNVACSNPHGTVESNFKHRFSVKVWCGVVGDHLIGPYIFPQRLTGGT